MKQQVFILQGDGPGLLVRRQQSAGLPVLYVHGATFPSALSAAYRFNGRSWMDDWNARGFDAWAFDFAGYGGSDRYGDVGAIPGRAPEAAAQIARVVSYIVSVAGQSSIAIVAHSWGTIPAALFAIQNLQAVKALCLFGPVLRRDGEAQAPLREKYRLVTIGQQLARFIEDVPPDRPPVLIEPQLEAWGPAYIASESGASLRLPAAVKIPNGPAADISAAWSGDLAYDPRDLHCPVLCVRGEWDSVTSDADAAWLLSRLRHSTSRDVKISKGTHLVHLEHSREDLFAAVGDFLKRNSGLSPMS
ncbi:MAG: alpha/beta hydrolase [Proteobacteria bacterium]|nr:alpha/beta hydrolase [Pseudomonadota bacterium]